MDFGYIFQLFEEIGPETHLGSSFILASSNIFKDGSLLVYMFSATLQILSRCLLFGFLSGLPLRCGSFLDFNALLHPPGSMTSLFFPSLLLVAVRIPGNESVHAEAFL